MMHDERDASDLARRLRGCVSDGWLCKPLDLLLDLSSQEPFQSSRPVLNSDRINARQVSACIMRCLDEPLEGIAASNRLGGKPG